MTETMTSRERMLAAARGLPPDHVPLMIWLNPHTTCQLLAEFAPAPDRIPSLLGRSLWRRFLRRGGMQADAWSRALPLIMEEYGNSSYALALGGDIAVLSPAFISPLSFITSVRSSGGRISVSAPFGGSLTLCGIYMHPKNPAVSSPAELASLRLPLVNAAHFNGVRQFKQKHPGACLLVEIGAMQQVLCDYILGSQNFMLALYDYPAEIKAFMRRLGAWLEEIIHLAADAGADVIFLQDDYGSNQRPLISMKMWDEITFPQLARLVSAAHAYRLPFMLHSCGYQMPFLERYVAAGVDILQSFQSGAGNDLEQAYALTQGRLTFATGIDVQQAEHMTSAEITQSIREKWVIGVRNGRFILATSHMLQHNLPREKMDAIFTTARELQRSTTVHSL